MTTASPKRLSLPIKIEIAKPCPAKWDEMDGDDKTRFCHACKKNVYNLMEYSDEEVQEFLARGDVCGRVYQRKDGTILTRDCAVGLRIARDKVHRALFRAVTAVVMLSAGTALAVVNLGKQRVDSDAVSAKIMSKMTEWIGPVETFYLGQVLIPTDD